MFSYSQETNNVSKLKEQLNFGITDSARISVNFKLGKRFLYKKNDSSLFYFNRALKIANKINDSIVAGDIYYNIGYKYYLNNNYKKSLESYYKARDFYTVNENLPGVAEVNNHIGLTYAHFFDEEKAIGYYLESMALYRFLNDEEGIATNLTDIGTLYYDYKNYELAIEKYKDALHIYQEKNDLKGVSRAYTNIGNAVSDNGDPNKGLNYYLQSIGIQNEIGDSLGIAINYNNIGDCYIALKKYNKAISYFNKALAFDTNVLDDDLISILYLNLADTRLKLKEYNTAISDAKRSLEISEEIGNVSYSLENYKSLSTSYEKLGNNRLAFKYLKQYGKLYDSLGEKDDAKKIQLINSLKELEEYEFKLKELESQKKISDLKYSNERKLIYFLIGASVVFCILLIVLINQQTEKKKAFNLLSFRNHQIKHMNVEIQKQSDDLKKMNKTKDKFFSIIAHDLKNPFNSIKGFTELMIDNIIEYPQEKQLKFLKIIKDSSTQASNLLDNLLIWANSQSGGLKINTQKINLLELVKDVAILSEIQAINKEISLINLIDSNVNVYADKNMLSTVIRNLLSNAIKFTNQGGKVQILAKKLERDFIQVSIKDNGIGMDVETIEKLFSIEVKQVSKGTYNETGTGLGLILCKDFIEKLGGEIWVISEKNIGSEFIFKLPVKKK